MKEYMNAKDIQKLTGLGYQQSMNIIKKIRKKMEEKGYYVPQGRSKLALTWMVRKELGIR